MDLNCFCGNCSALCVQQCEAMDLVWMILAFLWSFWRNARDTLPLRASHAEPKTWMITPRTPVVQAGVIDCSLCLSVKTNIACLYIKVVSPSTSWKYMAQNEFHSYWVDLTRLREIKLSLMICDANIREPKLCDFARGMCLPKSAWVGNR